MGFDKLSPGCGCCGLNCTLATDDFNRDDSTDVGDDWEETSGDWEIDTNEIKTSDTSALLFWDTTFLTSSHLVKVDVKGATGDKVRLIGRATSKAANAGWAAEVEIGATSTVQIYSGSSSVRCCKTTAISANTFFELKMIFHQASTPTPGAPARVLCFIDGTVVAGWTDLTFGGGGGFASVFYDGLGTGSSASTSIRFDNFESKRISPSTTSGKECPAEQDSRCAYWPAAYENSELDITISGTTTNGCSNDCTTIDGTYTLANNAGSCSWTLDGIGGDILTKITAQMSISVLTVFFTVTFWGDCGSGEEKVGDYQDSYNMAFCSPPNLCDETETVTLDLLNSYPTDFFATKYCVWPSTIDITATEVV